MPTITWLGKAASRARIDTIDVDSAANTETFIATRNGKSVTYTAGAGETTATVAAGWLVLLQASTEPEFTELTFAAGSATDLITVTGPADGAPFTVTISGTGTASISTTTAGISPHDANNGANYSGGALPSASDTLVFENSNVSVLYNLTALAAIALTKTIRRATYTGQIGLPDTNPAGYVEDRTTHLSLNSATVDWQASPADAARQFRLNGVTTGCVMTVHGDNATTEVGAEALEVKGFVATSDINVSGASIAVCPLESQTAAVRLFKATDSTFTIGSGASATLTNPTFSNSRGELRSNFTTITVDGAGSDVMVSGTAAAGTGVTVLGGVVEWKSSGTSGTIAVSSNGEFTANEAPAAFTVGAITLHKDSTLRDLYDRMTRPWAITFNNCTLAEVNLELSPGRTLTASA